MEDRTRDRGTAIPIDRELREATEEYAAAERELEAAKRRYDRIKFYLDLRALIRDGWMLDRNKERGFFVRSYARALSSKHAFRYDEFHIPAFTASPERAAAELPPELQGGFEDRLLRPCPTSGCQNRAAPVVGAVITNRGGYHSNGDRVTFFTLCPTCRTPAKIDSGYTADPED